jgi:hypothetical protein
MLLHIGATPVHGIMKGYRGCYKSIPSGDSKIYAFPPGRWEREKNAAGKVLKRVLKEQLAKSL